MWRSIDTPKVQVRLRRLLFGIIAEIDVAPAAIIHNPVHLCFGMVQQIGAQRVYLRVNIGDGASVRFLAHCLFSSARRARHIMHPRMHIGRDAQLVIEEAHVHVSNGGIRIKPEAHVTLIGASHNLVTEDILQRRTGRGLPFFGRCFLSLLPSHAPPD